MKEPPAYLAELARFACSARLEDLGGRALERTRWVIADSLPVVAAGMQQPEMQAFVQKHLARRRRRPRVGARHAPARERRPSAALLNGTAGTWLELDEGNLHRQGPSGHPGRARRGGARAGGRALRARNW